MIIATYHIAFDVQIENSTTFVHLSAMAELHHSDHYYLVKDFKMGNQQKEIPLPAIAVKKINGIWVHTESGKETLLSDAIGKAIEKNALPGL